MNPFKRNFLQHALAVGEWMTAHRATGGLDVVTLQMQISLGGKSVRFYPQFTTRPAEGDVCFIAQLQPGVDGFVGWYPYQRKVWPAAQNKIAFKQIAQRAKIRIPAWSRQLDDAKGVFLIKSETSSFGLGQRGPYVRKLGQDIPDNLQLADGEYIEQFILGRLLKAWFWDDRLAVLELSPMPFVEGDGVRSVAQLLQKKLPPNETFPSSLDSLLRVQGKTQASVPSPSEPVVVDYLYTSPLNPAATQDHDIFPQSHGTALAAQLASAGQTLWAAIPAELRQGTVMSVDGVVDEKGQIWFLEANCNPQLHPSIYDHMLNAVFGLPNTAQTLTAQTEARN